MAGMVEMFAANIQANKQTWICRTVILVEKFKSVAHYTLQAKSCVLQSKKEKSSKIFATLL